MVRLEHQVHDSACWTVYGAVQGSKAPADLMLLLAGSQDYRNVSTPRCRYQPRYA